LENNTVVYPGYYVIELTGKKMKCQIIDEVINSELIGYLTDKYSDIWFDNNYAVSLPERSFNKNDKKELEGKLNEFISQINPKSRFPFLKRRKNLNVEQSITEFFKVFSESSFSRKFEAINKIPVNQFISATKCFVKRSREFDSTLSMDDIYQACRNVWIMNIIQQMAGKKVEITPSVFAYSLLYPYCDNFIDSANVTIRQKIEFGEKLKCRLKGESIIASDPLEQKVFCLIEMIEEEFRRDTFPQVYESLLAIHAAQIKSLAMQLQATGLAQKEMLNIHIEKGGTSVLADGCLILGSLTTEQMGFVFGLGAYLQFTDDMQDIKEDIESGNFSIFANEARKGVLDDFANRTFNFGNSVLKSGACLGGDDEEAYLALLKTGMDMFLSVLIGMLDAYYTPQYVKYIEMFSPFGFSYIRKNYKKYSEKGMLLLEEFGK